MMEQQAAFVGRLPMDRKSTPGKQEITRLLSALLASPGVDGHIEVLSATPNWIALRFDCEPALAECLLELIDKLMCDLAEQLRDKISIALREILTNAMEHGCGFDPKKRIYIGYVRTSRVILIRIGDEGGGFRRDAIPHAASANPTGQPFNHLEYRSAHGMRPGGFGLMIAERGVDELLFNEKGNEALLIHYL
jgi:Anti-sigma regulatory factor (Ser/Thr protein kinase)